MWQKHGVSYLPLSSFIMKIISNLPRFEVTANNHEGFAAEYYYLLHVCIPAVADECEYRLVIVAGG